MEPRLCLRDVKKYVRKVSDVSSLIALEPPLELFGRNVLDLFMEGCDVYLTLGKYYVIIHTMITYNLSLHEHLEGHKGRHSLVNRHEAAVTAAGLLRLRWGVVMRRGGRAVGVLRTLVVVTGRRTRKSRRSTVSTSAFCRNKYDNIDTTTCKY